MTETLTPPSDYDVHIATALANGDTELAKEWEDDKKRAQIRIWERKFKELESKYPNGACSVQVNAADTLNDRGQHWQDSLDTLYEYWRMSVDEDMIIEMEAHY